MPPKAKKGGLDRNVGLENRLINDFDMPRDMVFRMTKEEQRAELERLEGRAPRPPEETYEELFADARQRNPLPAHAPAPAPAEDTEVADAPAPAEQDDVNPEDDHPMEIDDDETVDRIIQAAESTNDENGWLLQQPMQPPVAGRLAAEAAEILNELLEPINDGIREEINNMPYDQQIVAAQQIMDEQWNLPNTPLPRTTRGIPLTYFPADLRPRADQLPLHLQDLLAGATEHAQPERYNQQREQFRRQIDLDPLLSTNPDVRQWLLNTPNATQHNYLAANTFDRFTMLQDNRMLIRIQNWGQYMALPVSEEYRRNEQMAMQQANLTDYQVWVRSTVRMCWIVWAVRCGLMRMPSTMS
ncbi:unnamed protein product [Aureobasidium mustum]|uniref:Uncharacterized protein n=1 Tax=Aureobasidium mustum TaxID=2773714 RepID=A0A9N8K9R4_9PEZI|nr:unnamed protein product [Aureobasidium mustum]